MPRTAFPRLPSEVPEFDPPATPEVEQPVVPPIAPLPRWSWLELAAAAYLASAGLVVAWLMWGAVATTKACRHAENAPESLREELARIVGDGRRAPRLLVSSRVTTAVALGLRRPDDPPARRARPRGSAAGDSRGPDARMGAYPQRRFVALGPGAMPAGAALRRIRFSGGCGGRSAAIKSCWPTQPRQATTGRLMPKNCSAWSARPPIRRRSPLPLPSEFGRVRLNFQGELPCFWTRISASSRGPRAVGDIRVLGTPCDLGGGLFAADAPARAFRLPSPRAPCTRGRGRGAGGEGIGLAFHGRGRRAGCERI